MYMKVLVLSQNKQAAQDLRKVFRSAETLLGPGTFVHVGTDAELASALNPRVRVNLVMVIGDDLTDLNGPINMASGRNLSVIYCTKQGKNVPGAVSLRLDRFIQEPIRSLQPHMQV
jgi:hypothetical protein